MRTVDHLQEDELSAERQHSLLPIVWVPAALLENPVVRSDFAGEDLSLHVKLPHGGLRAGAELLLEDVMASRVLPALDSL